MCDGCHFAQQDGEWVHKIIDYSVQFSEEELDKDTKNAINDAVAERVKAQIISASTGLAGLQKIMIDSELAEFLQCQLIYNN